MRTFTCILYLFLCNFPGQFHYAYLYDKHAFCIQKCTDLHSVSINQSIIYIKQFIKQMFDKKNIVDFNNHYTLFYFIYYYYSGAELRFTLHFSSYFHPFLYSHSTFITLILPYFYFSFISISFVSLSSAFLSVRSSLFSILLLYLINLSAGVVLFSCSLYIFYISFSFLFLNIYFSSPYCYTQSCKIKTIIFLSFLTLF